MQNHLKAFGANVGMNVAIILATNVALFLIGPLLGLVQLWAFSAYAPIIFLLSAVLLIANYRNRKRNKTAGLREHGSACIFPEMLSRPAQQDASFHDV